MEVMMQDLQNRVWADFFFHAAAVFFFCSHDFHNIISFSSLGFFWCPMHGVILIYTVDFWLCYI